MKRSLSFFFIIFCLVLSISSKADDVLIPFGQNLSGAPTWKYKGGGTNLDAVAWKTLGYAEPGWVSGGSALGFGGSPVRNTNIPEDASAGGGGVSGSRYPTLYFRKTINIASPATYGNFLLRTQFDDAIVVWINGVEAFRNNISANPAYATLATTFIANNGNDIFSQTLNTSLFVAGNNIIAVEIHQSSATSSDLFFDLELTGVIPPSPDVVLLPYGQNLAGAPAWKYKGGGTNLDGTNWKDLGYAEPSWVTGNSALGFGASAPVHNTAIPQNTSAGGGGTSSNRYPTMYFRKVVNIADPTIYAGIRISTKFDDAVVVWVNGVEAYINNINSFPAYADWALSAITGNGSVEYSTIVPTSMFVAGNNIIAVEVHQVNATSSDLFFDLQLGGVTSMTASLTRGPYLQMGNQTSIMLRWRTDNPTDSRVTWGTVLGTYPNTVDSTKFTTEHMVTISGLTPDTKYYYTIGSTTNTLQGAADNYFTTLPPSNTTRKIKVMAYGDCGTGSTVQRDVRDAFISYANANAIQPDAWLLLGDNGYNAGLDAEYSSGFFNTYQATLLKHIKLYPAPGNHDYSNNSTNQGLRNLPYYQTFSMPTNGEIGGVPSNTKAFYSYNIGDIHFVSLDSYGRENGNTTRLYDTTFGNVQADWLRNDLAANTKKWTVVYFHHPPYTKGSHNSDAESDLMSIHARVAPILERYGVDLVINGHSHCYERSYLVKDIYYNSNLYVAANNLVSGSTARYDGGANSCPYTSQSGQVKHGTVYIVAGSSGQVGGNTGSQPYFYYTNYSNAGSFYFEVDSNRLDAKFISYTGTGATVAPLIRDQFTIFKDVNKTQNLNVTTGTPLTLTASWRGTYNWPNNANASTQSVTLANATNGSFVYTVNDNNNCIQDIFNVTVSGTVPIILTSFTATPDKDKVLLNWATSQEQNNKFFTIEKSYDGINYSLLGKVNAAGISTTATNYQLVDYAPAEGINYYRLSQTDFDGHTIYHGIKTANFSNGKSFNTIIRNNGDGKISVVIKSQKTTQVAMQVVDMLGKQVLKDQFVLNAGSIIKNLNLNSGVYVLVLVNGNGEKITDKIIVH